jgi:hypothetical protein
VREDLRTQAAHPTISSADIRPGGRGVVSLAAGPIPILTWWAGIVGFYLDVSVLGNGQRGALAVGIHGDSARTCDTSGVGLGHDP